MAKSIWKPGVKITRKEKKALRRLMPHPNKGRRLYQWKVENSRISRVMKDVLNDDGTLNIDPVKFKETCDEVIERGLIDRFKKEPH